ncbi:MAG: hypothetical protein WCP58_12145 [bacterium]|jgi:hypothetical protein
MAFKLMLMGQNSRGKITAVYPLPSWLGGVPDESLFLRFVGVS